MTKKRTRTKTLTGPAETTEPASPRKRAEKAAKVTTSVEAPEQATAAPEVESEYQVQAPASTEFDLSREAPSIESPVEASDSQPDPSFQVESEEPVVESQVSHDSDPSLSHASGEDLSDARHEQRHTHTIKTVVHFKESAEESWREVIEIATVSRNGAGMLLSRPCPVGRIVSLVMEMPQKLRLYDQFAEVYPIAGVVQNCTELMQEGSVAYHVGVAFIGKSLPDSYRTDPTTTYRITGVNQLGLWTVGELHSGFKGREHARFWTKVDMSVTYRDDENKKVERAAVQTRDISRGGMAVWGPLSIDIGERVKVSSKEHDFFSMGTVRNRTDHPREDDKSLVHIQFEESFPIEMIQKSGSDGDKDPK